MNATTTQPDDLTREGAMTINAAVAWSGIGRTELYRLMNTGELVYSQWGKRRLILRASLQRVLANGMDHSSRRSDR